MNLRISERAAVSIQFDAEPEGGKASVAAFMYDLWQDGCLIEFVDRPPDINNRVIVLLDGETVASGRLVWRMGRNAGLQFAETLEKTAVDRLTPKQARAGITKLRRQRVRWPRRHRRPLQEFSP